MAVESGPARPRLSDDAVAGGATAAIMLAIQLAGLWVVAANDPVAAVEGAVPGLPALNGGALAGGPSASC
jgi:hypothetical protein